jgi:hypothetical protein
VSKRAVFYCPGSGSVSSPFQFICRTAFLANYLSSIPHPKYIDPDDGRRMFLRSIEAV